jgi:hypothetical protein
LAAEKARSAAQGAAKGATAAAQGAAKGAAMGVELVEKHSKNAKAAAVSYGRQGGAAEKPVRVRTETAAY